MYLYPMAGIYLHIPYCKKACHYCDFHFSTSQRSRGELIRHMLQELELRKDYLGNEPVESIYLGGGTPSLLDEDELNSLLDQIHSLFTVVPAAEITLEANPDDLDPSKLEILQRSAVNRLSIGVQSFFEEDLTWMNRAHSAAEAKTSIQLAQSAGFNNISIDLIYGYPLLTDEKWATNVREAINLNIQHLSCYSMTVEPATALDLFIKKGKTAAMNEEQSAAQFGYLMKTLGEHGIAQYEISNFSRPGFHARHNSNYWNGKNYLGIGPSAHSFNQHSRESNIANNNLYISMLKSGGSARKMFEVLSPVNQLNELIMTSLRTTAGLDLNLVEKRFGTKVRDNLSSQAAVFEKKGWINLDAVNIGQDTEAGAGGYASADAIGEIRDAGLKARLALSPEGMKFCDLITAELFHGD